MTLMKGTNYSGFDSELERLRKANENFSGNGFLVVVNRLFDLSGGFGVEKQDRKLNEKTLHFGEGKRRENEGEESASGSCNRLRQERQWTCKRNVVARSRNVCTSSGTLRAWYLFTRSHRIYGDLMWPQQLNLLKVHYIFPRFQ